MVCSGLYMRSNLSSALVQWLKDRGSGITFMRISMNDVCNFKQQSKWTVHEKMLSHCIQGVLDWIWIWRVLSTGQSFRCFVMFLYVSLLCVFFSQPSTICQRLQLNSKDSIYLPIQSHDQSLTENTEKLISHRLVELTCSLLMVSAAFSSLCEPFFHIRQILTAAERNNSLLKCNFSQHLTVFSGKKKASITFRWLQWKQGIMVSQEHCHN